MNTEKRASSATDEPRRPGRTEGAEQHLPESSGRTFPCAACGGDMEFHIGEQSLACPYCGTAVELPAEGETVVEQDYEAMLRRLEELRREGGAVSPGTEVRRCTSCAAEVVFTDTVTSGECAYCAAPTQRDEVHKAEDRVPVDGVLPFQVERREAQDKLRRWVESRWFAPNKFKKRGVEGRFTGVFLPFWTFDSLTTNRYRGERGEVETVTVRVGGERRRRSKVRWFPAAGRFQRFFDDVLVAAARGLADSFLRALEPWPLERLVPFEPDFLAGFEARTYDLSLEEGFRGARRRIRTALEREVRARIGGDRQRIHSHEVRFDAVTYKHLLLPVWLLTYRHGSKAYQVVVNAVTGEVHGKRPWSWVKILCAVLALQIVLALIR